MSSLHMDTTVISLTPKLDHIILLPYILGGLPLNLKYSVTEFNISYRGSESSL